MKFCHFPENLYTAVYTSTIAEYIHYPQVITYLFIYALPLHKVEEIEMRTIKFRAWDKENKREEFTYMSMKEMVEWDCACELRGEVMQFTGLKDKNGKEIYEGDIVKRGCGTEKQKKEIHVVKYKEWSFHPFGFLVPNKCEVIGNIYENPKLLKEE